MEAAKAAAQGALAPLVKTTLLAAHADRSSMPVHPASPVWHNSSPQPITLSSMKQSQLMPSPYSSIPVKLNLMNYTAFSLRILFGREHTAPAYNHNPSGDEEHNE